MVIAIHDRGMVISNDGPPLSFDEKKLFRRFTRDARKSGSFGLGLSLVKKICDTYQISISYRYENQKHNFFMLLPE
jgi:signal transduction histidine kinase